MWNLKRSNTSNTKQKETHRLKLWLPGGRNKEFGMDMYTPLYLKWITIKALLCSTGNSAHCHVAAWMGGDWGKNGYM